MEMEGEVVEDPTAEDLAAVAEEFGSSEHAAVQSNGVRLNGELLNGQYLNGVRLNGVRLNSSSLGSGALLDVRVDGSVITALRGAQRISGAALVGSVFPATMSDGSAAELRIDGFAELSPAAVTRDVFTYDVVTRPAGSATWTPLCGVESGARVQAIALSGRWDYRSGVPGGGSRIADPTALTFACRGAALAKCVEMGYRPWGTVPACTGRVCANVSLADHHQACTRMVRADYCGNGTAHTRNGRPINVFDGIGIQDDTQPLWLMEAEWDASGARCVSIARRQLLNLPTCYLDRVVDNLLCGSRLRFQQGTMLMNEIALISAP